MPALPAPPDLVLRNATLFLDLDGTLLELADRPDHVRADRPTQALLDHLLQRLDGRVAVISGRSLDQIDKILGRVSGSLWLSGSHGCEQRREGVAESVPAPASLETVGDAFRAFAQGRAGVLVETKTLGVALHYRMAPDAEEEAVTLAKATADCHGLYLQRGKMMVELRAGDGDKGNAIAKMMKSAHLARGIPVFAGDDVTDEAGFTAVRNLGGYGLLVGEPRLTAATFGLSSPAALREWLWRATQ